jgi:hypothetical protein
MNRPRLEDELHDVLHRLASQVSAPASAEAGQSIDHRTGVLRRRRQMRYAVGGGVLAVAVVTGALALRGGEPSDVETGFTGREGSLPDLTVDLDGWRITSVDDASDTTVPSGEAPGAVIQTGVPPDFVPGGDPASIWDGEWLLGPGPEIAPPWAGGSRGSIQVFRVPGQPRGPTVVVRLDSATDTVVAQEGLGEEAVSVGERAENDGFRNGAVRQAGTNGFVLKWSPVSLGDSYAALQSWGLTEDQVLELAGGLQPRFDEAAAADETGFEATVLPKGLEEEPVAAIDVDRQERRLVTLEGSDGSGAEIRMDSRGEMAYDVFLAVLLATSGGEFEEVTVLDRPALLFENAEIGEWHVLWRHTDDVTVALTLTGVDRSTVDDVIDGLREGSAP